MNFFNLFKNLSLFFLVLFFSFLATNLILLNVFASNFLNEGLIISELEGSNFYDSMISDAAQGMHSSMSRDKENYPITAKQLEDLFRKSLTKEIFDKQLKSALTGFFSFIKGETEELEMKISFKEVKENFKESLSKEIIFPLLESSENLPEEFEKAENAGTQEIAEMILEKAEIPDEIDLAESLGEGTVFQSISTILRLFNSLNFALIVLSIILFTAIILIANKISLIFTYVSKALIEISLGLGLVFIAIDFLRNKFIEFSSSSAGIYSILLNLIEKILSNISSEIFTYLIFFIIFSMISVSIKIFISKKIIKIAGKKIF